MKNIVVLPFLLCGLITVRAQEGSSTKKEKTNTLNEISITKEKKAIEQKADRTIFDFAAQSHLNSGSVLEGIKKLPGLVASDVAGMMYQGKQLDVYMDGRPLNIFSNELNAFLEGLPANSVEKIEIITQPGAEFPATSGGAILNIITNKKAKSYLSATYNNSTNATNYDKLRLRTNNSILLSSKNKLFGWQLNLGQNYAERALWSEVARKENGNTTILSKNEADRINRTTFAKSALTFDLGNDRLLLNYDVFWNRNNSYTDAFGTLPDASTFQTLDKGSTKATRQEAVATYQKRFENKARKLDFSIQFNQNNNQFALNAIPTGLAVLENTSLQNLYNVKGDYSQPLHLFGEDKISFGALYESLQFTTKSAAITNLDYQRETASTYLELQSSIDKIDFILGGRAENYAISGATNTNTLTPFHQFRFFPNASVQYNFVKGIFFNTNYNKKITLPSTSALNPNNTNYQNPNVNYVGNPQLQPTIYDNYEVKISAFDYAFVSYNVSVAKNQVINKVMLNSNVVTNSNVNVTSMTTRSWNFGLPLPYMLFTKGLKETMKFDFNPDKINFMYLYAGRQLHDIPNVDTKGFWIFNVMSQIILPKDIKFVTNFSHITAKGNYYYFVAQKPFNESLDMSFSKKFWNNQLTVSINVDDILNSYRSIFNAYQTPLYLSSKNDTRRFGFSINYKIPTKNKLAKEDPNLLNKDKKEETPGGVIGN